MPPEYVINNDRRHMLNIEMQLSREKNYSLRH